MTQQSVDILLVEDNPHDVEMTLRVLSAQKPGTRIEVARDGEEALQFLFSASDRGNRSGSGAPKVILLDLKLPFVSGVEVLRKLKGDVRTQTIPVVILSTSREHSDVAECYQLGANSYLVKPVDFDEFSETMRTFGRYWLQLNEPPQPEIRG